MFFMLLSFNLKGQEDTTVVSKNIIFFINQDLAISSITHPKIITYERGNKNVYNIYYYIGKLNIKKIYLNEINNSKIDSMFIYINYQPYQKGKKHREFYMPVSKTLLFNTMYSVFYIYDLRQKKYRNMFVGKHTKDFLMEYHTSTGSMLRIRNKPKKKKRCDCDD
jgi:hypothetical protein